MKAVRRQVICAALASVLATAGCAHASVLDDFFIAIRRDNAGAVAELLRRGANPNGHDENGEGALTLAIKQESMAVVPVLLAWPATQVEVRNAQGESPLMLAAIKGQTELVRALIARDADVNKTGWAPLHYAVSVDSPQQLAIVRLLLDASAYIDAESPNRTTPLMMAARYGSDQAVKLLFDEGADPTARNQQGLRAGDFARLAGRTAIGEQLDKVAATWRRASATSAAPAAPRSSPANVGSSPLPMASPPASIKKW